MSYEIVGRYLSEGEETPHFDVWLRSFKVPVCRITSDGRGGESIIEWTDFAPRDGAVRENAVAWLAAEARRAWATICPGEDFPEHAARAQAAALLVVPEHLR